MLITVEETRQKITEGKFLFLAGEESLLQQLPKGQWIGGTIPYFMTEEKGGLYSNTHIFVHEAPNMITEINIISYNRDNIQRIPTDAPENGFSLMIIPALSPAHFEYAKNAPNFKGIFFKPIIGWIAGVHLEQLGQITPKVFDGESGQLMEKDAIVMHLSLPTDKMAEIKTLNIFEQGDGDDITFDIEGFNVEDCYINGEKQNFALYLSERKIGKDLPLVADYYGTRVNVSILNIDDKNNLIQFAAPIFKHVTYRFAAPIPDYEAKFSQIIPKGIVTPVFTCNCLYNYT
jgi:hypothetical protein